MDSFGDMVVGITGDSLERFWNSTLLSHLTVEEKLGIKTSVCKNARQLLDIDFYTAHAIYKCLKTKTIAQLYQWYVRKKEEGDPSILEQLTAACLSSQATAEALRAILDSFPDEIERTNRKAILQAFEEEAAAKRVSETSSVTPADILAEESAEDRWNRRLREASAMEAEADDDIPERLPGSRLKDEQSASEEEEEDFEEDGAPLRSECRRKSSTLREVEEVTSKMLYLNRCRELSIVPATLFMKQISARVMILDHYGLGNLGIAAVAAGLGPNKSIRALHVADNGIHAAGMRALAFGLKRNQSLTSLNLSDNPLGAQGLADLSTTLAESKTITTLILKGCSVEDSSVIDLVAAVQCNPTLTALDLSFNRINESGIALGNLLEMNGSLRRLVLKWNMLGPATADAMSEGLKKNGTLEKLDLSWNSIGTEGATSLAEAITHNSTLRELDLQQNRIGHPGAKLLADALMFNTTIFDFNISYNPLTDAGSRQMINTLLKNTCLKNLGLTGTECGFELADRRTAFDASDPVGHYELDLSVNWDHALAELLRLRSVESKGRWSNIFLNRQQFPTLTVLDPAWSIPSRGLLSFDYTDIHPVSLKEAEDPRPLVHYQLDLRLEGDRRLVKTLIKRAIDEEGENWLHEKLDGENFDLPETEEAYEWLERHPEGILELDYVSTNLRHEQAYRLDLSNSSDLAMAMKLLERVFLGEGDPCGDIWKSMRINGREFHLEQLRVGLFKDGRWISGKHVLAKNVRSKWRLPTSGILEFIHLSNRPQHVLTHHYRLNLAVPADRMMAENLRVRSMKTPGEVWWNETIDGLPFSLDESILEEPAPPAAVMPRRGSAPMMQKIRLKTALGPPVGSPRKASVPLAAPPPRRKPSLAKSKVGELFRSVEEEAKRKCSTVASYSVFPFKGVLELDFVITRPVESSRKMVRTTVELPLDSKENRLWGALLHRRTALPSVGEFWLNVWVNGRNVPPSIHCHPEWRLGKLDSLLRVDVIHFSPNESVPQRQFDLLCREAERASTAQQRSAIFRQLVEGEECFVTVDQALKALKVLSFTQEQVDACRLLLPKLLDTPRAFVLSPVLCHDAKEMLVKWFETGVIPQ